MTINEVIKLHHRTGAYSIIDMPPRSIKTQDIIAMGVHLKIDPALSCGNCLFSSVLNECEFFNVLDAPTDAKSLERTSYYPSSGLVFRIDICNQVTQSPDFFTPAGFKLRE